MYKEIESKDCITIGECIITTIDKTVDWGREKIFIPKGTIGLVCETYEKGTILVEIGDNKNIPWILATLYDGEYEKEAKK